MVDEIDNVISALFYRCVRQVYRFNLRFHFFLTSIQGLQGDFKRWLNFNQRNFARWKRKTDIRNNSLTF